MKTGHKFFFAFLAAVVVIFFLVITFGNQGLVDVYSLKKERDRLEEKNRCLKKENAGLRRTIDRLIHDPEYVESVAREELGMVGGDEIIYHFKTKAKKQDNK